MSYRNVQAGTSAPAASYGATTTIDRLAQYTDDLTLDWDPNDQFSEVVTSDVVASADGSYRPTESASGGWPFEVKSKGFGRLLNAALGASTTNLVSAGLYQQNHTFGTGNTLPDFNMQAVRKLFDDTDQVDTYLGVIVNALELKMDAAGVLVGSADLDARTMVTNVAKASLSVVAAKRFTFAGFSMSTGTITEATTTALATAPTALDGIKAFSVKIENQMVVDDYRGGGTGLKTQPTRGEQPKVTGTMKADYTSQIATLFRTGWINNTGVPLIANFVNGTDQVQVVLPYCRVSKQPTPNMDGKQPEIDIEFEVLKSSAYTQPLWISLRTADTAL